MSGAASGMIPVWIGGAAATVAVAAGVTFFVTRESGTSDTPVPVAVRPAEEDATASAAEPPVTGDAGATNIDASASGPVEDASEAEPPRLQEVRVEPDGLAVIAGSAPPLSKIAILLDAAPLAEGAADASGSFATIAFLSPSEAPRVLSMLATTPDGEELQSPDELILAPLAAPDVVAATEEPVTENTQGDTETATATPSVDADEAVVEEPAPTQVATVADPAPAREEPELAALDPEDALVVDLAPGGAVSVAQEPEPEPEQAVVSAATPSAGEPATGSGKEAQGNDPVPAAQIASSEPEPEVVQEQKPATPEVSQPVKEVDAATLDNIETAALDLPEKDQPAPVAEPDVQSEPEAAAQPAAPETEVEPPSTQPQPEPSTPPEQLVVATPSQPATEPEPAAPATSDPDPAPQVAILKSNEDGVEVVQPPSPAPEVMSQVALDSISYSEAGDVRLTGRAQSAAREVLVYLNNAPIATLDVDDAGGWRGALPDVDTGVYTLRIDEVDEAGEVTSRVETPFKREDPEVLEAATSNPDAAVSAVTVQAGNTLWAIARDRYGEGTLYVKVVEANRKLIRDPNLIYPGQVFNLPTE